LRGGVQESAYWLTLHHPPCIPLKMPYDFEAVSIVQTDSSAVVLADCEHCRYVLHEHLAQENGAEALALMRLLDPETRDVEEVTVRADEHVANNEAISLNDGALPRLKLVGNRGLIEVILWEEFGLEPCDLCGIFGSCSTHEKRLA
jgi:hypothetical protein